MKKLLLIPLIFVLFGTAHAEPSQPPFDHENCQYPDRTTNPVDGCDNTDPCDPANVKGGDGSCKPQPQVEAQLVVEETPVFTGK